MISFVTGDLLASTEDYIAQGVAEGNQEGLGTGLALKSTRLCPHLQDAFRKPARSCNFSVGDICTFPPDPSHPGFVYMATQPDMYHATMPYLRKAVRNLTKWADKHGIGSV